LSAPDLKKIPGIQLGDEGPVFNEPWEANAFALVVGLHQKGMFEWVEWADVLSKTIHSDDGSTPYYRLWLQALEIIVSEKNLLNDNEISMRSEDWSKALLATPHGEPIELQNGSKRL